MSIINDALKKLQDQIADSQIGSGDNQQTGRSAPMTAAEQAGFKPSPSRYSSTTSASQKTEKKSAESRLVMILGLLCLLIALFVPIVNKQSLLTMLWAQIPQKPKTITIRPTQTVQPQTTSPATVTNIAPQPLTQQEPVKQVVKTLTAPVSKPAANTSSSRIIVNGIMTRGEQNLALIDGQIYEEGEEVGGVKLIKITPKGVTVLDNGVERSIKVLGQ